MSRQINQKKEAFFGVRRSIQVGGHCRVVCGVISIRTALALKSGGNRLNRGFDICNPGRLFFDLFTQTIYAAVLRSVSAYGNSDGKDSLYGSAETFAPRPGFNGLKKTAAQLITDTVPASPTSPQDCCRTSGTVSVLTFPARRPNAGAGRAAAAYNVRSRVLTTAKRSSAATCADYTCFPAGSRRQAPFLSCPTPLCGVRSRFPVRRKSASLKQVYSPRTVPGRPPACAVPNAHGRKRPDF